MLLIGTIIGTINSQPIKQKNMQWFPAQVN
jgi:hypothetical protein